jgi:hypothetical protein
MDTSLSLPMMLDSKRMHLKVNLPGSLVVVELDANLETHDTKNTTLRITAISATRTSSCTSACLHKHIIYRIERHQRDHIRMTTYL